MEVPVRTERFLGEQTLRIDDKGRLFLPAKYRDRLAGGVVIAKGDDPSLLVFTDAGFEAWGSRLDDNPFAPADVRHKATAFFASAHSDVPDRQGRVTLPLRLREYAGLDQDCTVIGASSRLEIWATDRWEAQRLALSR